MSERIICLHEESTGRVAQFGVIGTGLACLGSSEGFARELEPVVTAMTSEGIHARVEVLDGHSVGVSFERIDANDARYLDAAADHFRAGGYTARVLDRTRAEAWRLLLTVGIDKDMQNGLLSSLEGIPDGDVVQLLAQLAEAERALLAADRAEREGYAKVAELETAELAAFVKKE
jgi:hypothetical protein